MPRIATIAGLVLVATSLTGCQSIFHSGTASADLRSVDMSDYFAQRLAAGKANLAAGRPAKAIEAFRQASYHPAYAGEAYNGMAIGYDLIGRADLAARFFAEAVEAAPGDERFARNLAKLEGRAVLPLPVLPEAAAPVETATAQPTPEVRGAVTIERAPERLSGAVQHDAAPQTRTGRNALRGPVRVEKATPARVARVAQGQVAVGTAPAAAATRMADKSVHPARITVESRPSIRMSTQQVNERARRNAQARKGYPIRIVLRSDDSKARP